MLEGQTQPVGSLKIRYGKSALYLIKPYKSDLMNNIPRRGSAVSRKKVKKVLKLESLKVADLDKEVYYSLASIKTEGRRKTWYVTPLYIRRGSGKVKVITVYRLQDTMYLEAAGKNHYYILRLKEKVEIRRF